MTRLLLCTFALVLALAPTAAAGTGMFVGAAEDAVRSTDPAKAKAQMDAAALAGFDTIRMTTTWTPGTKAVGDHELAVIRNAANAARLDGIRLILSVYQRDQRTTPRTRLSQYQFAAYAASIAQAVPWIEDFVIGNEPNLNRFWMPQFTKAGADAAAYGYQSLLALCYDALKRISPDINVIGGALSPAGGDRPKAARQTHSPTRFIADLGAAYRQSKRRRPIMDMFAFHPYLIPSRLPPTFAHPRTTTIGLADYAKLTALLTRAFAGTRQPGATLPIVYDEFGYQTRIPPQKRALYTRLGSPAAKDAISEGKQAAQYRQALGLAQCQPNVAGMLIFHVVDEADATAWQSGVYYADGTPKTSLGRVREAALEARSGALADCPRAKPTSMLEGVAFHEPPTATPDALSLDLRCATVCRYSATVFAADTGETAAAASGIAAAGEQRVELPADELAPGWYQYSLRVFAAGKPATASALASTPFAVPAPPRVATAELPAPGDGGDGQPPAAEPEPEPVPPPPLLFDPPLPTLVPTVPAP
jgi:hypothetical protein